MKKTRAFVIFFLALEFFGTLATLPAFADFQLLDVIQEFGEKRYALLPPPHIRPWRNIRFHPVLRTKVEYDDNILLANQSERRDIVYNLNPAAVVDIPSGRNRLTMGYESEFEIMTINSHQNDVNQNFFILGNAHFPSWYINVLENFSETSSRSGTTFTTRIPRYDQAVHPKIGYRWKRTVFESGFRHFLRNFRRTVDGPLDFQTSEWTEIIYYDFFAHLKALVEYQLAQIQYRHNSLRDGTFHQARAGFNCNLFPNFVAQVRVGPQFRNYGASTKNDFASWVGYASIEYEYKKKLKLNLSLIRQPAEATFQDINFYLEHGLRLGLEYKMGLRWTAFSQFKFIRERYAERATVNEHTGFRRDNHILVKTGLRYRLLESLEVQLAYEYAMRDSNFSNFDYADNRFSLSTDFQY